MTRHPFHITLLAACVGLLLLSACQTSKSISANNLFNIYRQKASRIHPDFLIYHQNDSLSRIYFRIPAEELLYAKKDTEEPAAKIKFSYKLYPSFESAAFLDSASLGFVDQGVAEPGRDIIGHFDIGMAYGQDYLLVVTTKDQHRNEESVDYLNVYKNNRNNRQNFLLRDAESRLPLFQPYALDGQEVFITASQSVDHLHVRHYNRDFNISPAPFAVYNPRPFDYRPDSVFALPLNDSNAAAFKLTGDGFYHFAMKPTVQTGISLFNFGEQYPKIGKAGGLLEPLRYVTTRGEYTEMINNNNQKEALDEFWLNSSPNPDRAKELIRKYYNRVHDANRFFTSYMEGWKTDRGMIYIVFGPPNIIYKSTNTESWVYGEEKNPMSLTLNFIKVDNPFTYNDFRLNRSPIYKNKWYRSVESWRQGRILVDN